MGLFKFLDKLGGAGVKVDPAKLKPAAEPKKEKAKPRKPATIKESIDRFPPVTTASRDEAKKLAEETLKRVYEETQKKMQEKEQLRKKYTWNDFSYEYDERGGCDACGSYNYYTDTLNGTKYCRECHWDQTQKMLNSEPVSLADEIEESLANQSLYDEGYSDGYAGMPPSEYGEDDEEYMMGYKDGEADYMRLRDAESEAAFAAAATTEEVTYPDLGCEQGVHMFKTVAATFNGNGQLVRCDGCGFLKHKKFLDN